MKSSQNLTGPLISLLVLLLFMAIYVALIMVIWNEVIIKKFPNQNIQKLSFWDALALSVFVSLLSGPSTANYFIQK